MTKRITLIPLKEKVKELEMFYYKIQKELGLALLSVDPANYQELAAIKVREKINMLIGKLNRASMKWSRESVPQAYEKSYVITKTKLEILGAQRGDSFSMKEHRIAIDNYIEKTMKNFVTANQSIKVNVNMYLYLARQTSFGLAQFQHFNFEDEAIINEIIMDTLELGRERAYASKRIHEYLRLQLLDGKFISKSGRNYNLRDYSKMVARTRLRQAQTDAVKNTCRQYDNDLVQWSSHASPCPICAPLEGRIFSISGNHPKYSLLMDEPPIHPNCEHDISPTSEVAIEFRHGVRERWA